MATGSRTEMVRRVGLSLTNFTRRPLDQSTYSVESAVDQNSNSSASLLNSGTFFMPFVLLKFPSIHIAGRDHPNQFVPDRIRNKEHSSARRAAYCPVALFARRESGIHRQSNRQINFAFLPVKLWNIT